MNEQERLAELYSLGILDTPAEKEYDDLVWLASSICSAPVGLMSLVDESRQWFKSSHGLSVTETARDVSFCAHAILRNDVLIVGDTLLDERFATNPLVTGPPKIRFYAGAPLILDSGNAIGTLCVIDSIPRQMTPEQIQALQVLSSEIVARIKLKRSNSLSGETLVRMHSVIENLQGGILLQDHLGKIILVNHAFCKMFLGQLQPQDIVGQLWKKHEASVEKILQSPGEVRKSTVQILQDNALVLCEKIFLKNGTLLERDHIPIIRGSLPAEHLWFYRDVTPRKQSERIIEIQRNHIHSNAKLSALGIMASGIAHEINNPLSIISGNVQQLQRLFQTDPFDKASAENTALKITHTVSRIAKIIDSLRIFVGEESKVPKKQISVKKVVDEVLVLSNVRIQARSIKMVISGVSDKVSVYARETQLVQVLLNLLNNAIDALEGVSEKWIGIDVFDLGSAVQINVIDSGPGIPPENRNQVMVPFFTTKPVGKGTGLGLSISKGIIEEMGGTFLLDENFPHTCFSVVLPKGKSLAPERHSILLVDDEPEIRQILRQVFEEKKWLVYEAGSGFEAMKVLGKNRISVILSDIRMPDGDGLEFLEFLRTGYSRKIPVFLVTGFTDLNPHEAIARGASALLTKPFILKDLFKTVASSV